MVRVGIVDIWKGVDFRVDIFYIIKWGIILIVLIV